MNRSKMLMPLVALAVALAWIGLSSFFVVPEGHQAIITQFGKTIGKPYLDAGLYFKLPVIQKVHMFEKRLLKWDGRPNEIPTLDKKYIFVDTTARWRITDPLRFLQTVATVEGAQSRLDDIIDSVVRDAVSRHLLVELVRSSNWKDTPPPAIVDDEGEGNQAYLAEMANRGQNEPPQRLGREQIVQEMIADAKRLTPEMGLEVVDIQVKRINYVDQVQKRVFERMISERKRIASQYRSEGEGEKQNILGRMNKELARIRSEAYRKSQEIRGQAEATANDVYGQAFSQDAEFYSLFKTLESYRAAGGNNTELILSTDGEYFKYVKKPQ
ncbi:HflC protein [Desulfarculus baarsii DSM 2075]|uniref:Protein HflC n=1 Tax=Desulfarculus baarsii (strain ATCC 33931 / DSM 2075 / LMG 7858 / VKM B-1802 / 2st14) TaxID=644282 RepID=E1QJL7_DESB2|nr:protease modulator HflC [Desulfarculus baarsii]ADK85760.1 HflC protein [Desulfarculus baarsii DSM 2075]